MNRIKQEHTDVILNSIADGVFTIDSKKRITSFNRAAERITGFDKEEAIGQYCYDDIFHSGIIPTFNERKNLKIG